MKRKSSLQYLEGCLLSRYLTDELHRLWRIYDQFYQLPNIVDVFWDLAV